jgi:hypothetical protein
MVEGVALDAGAEAEAEQVALRLLSRFELVVVMVEVASVSFFWLLQFW